MTAQIKSGGGGLDGIINAAGAVANATGTIVNSGQVLANNIATNAGNLSNNIRDAGSTNAAREARAEAQETLDKLTKNVMPVTAVSRKRNIWNKWKKR